MRITYHVEGGIAHFPGLARPRTVDTDTLPAALAEELCALAERVLATPPAPEAVAPGADMRTFVITIESGGQSGTFSVREPASSRLLASLIEKLKGIGPWT